jgi:hypothetical protein
MAHAPVKTVEGFPVYDNRHLRKVNALRMASSTVGVPDTSVPVLDAGQVGYLTAEEMNDIPCSCYHCTIYNKEAGTCGYMGPNIPVKKFIWPKESTADVKKIEYWPVCGAADPGEPHQGEAHYRLFPFRDPDNLGFGWINAPKIGLEYSGANCGGGNDGDDCDYYLIESGTKWDSATGWCRVMQKPVANGDVCACWTDDDWLDWRKGVEILNGR